MPRSTNPSRSGAEIVIFGFRFLLRFRDCDFWVWDFEKWVWMFEEGEEEGKTVLGRHMEKKRRRKRTKEEDGLQELES